MKRVLSLFILLGIGSCVGPDLEPPVHTSTRDDSPKDTMQRADAGVGEKPADADDDAGQAPGK